jgi:hypothetical protein
MLSRGPPPRSSLVDRPCTAASTSSAMRERGTHLRVKTQRLGASPPGTPPASPYAAASHHRASSDSGSRASSKAANSQSSVATLALVRSLRAANGGLELGMQQGRHATR